MIVSSLLFFSGPAEKEKLESLPGFQFQKGQQEKSLLCVMTWLIWERAGSSKARFCLPESRPNFLDKSEERPEASGRGKMDGISLEEETLEPAACTAIALGETMESSRKLNVERTCTLLLGRFSSGKKWLCGWAEEPHMSNRPPCVPGAMGAWAMVQGPQKQLREGMKLQGTT